MYFQNIFLSQLFDYKITIVIPLQHKLGLSADDGVRQLVEQTDGEVFGAERAVAIKVVVSKKANALHKKMSKLVYMENPELTDGWLRKVYPLL